MSIGGYKRSEGKRSGGIRSLAIAAVTDVEAVQHDQQTGCCTGIVLREGAGFAVIEFREGTASYSEKASAAEGVVKFAHRIEFSLERPDVHTAWIAGELTEASDSGMVAVVTANSGVSFLVGYSERLGLEQPLRFTAGSAETGRKFADDTCETILLASEDGSKAMVFTGELP